MFDFPQNLLAFCKDLRTQYSNQIKTYRSGGVKMAAGAPNSLEENIKAREEAIAELDAIIKRFEGGRQ